MPVSPQMQELTTKLQQGIADLWETGKYTAYLKTMSKFPKYSPRNSLLIHLQRPDATFVSGFQAWQDNFKRFVKKGEKAIKIFAPMPYVIHEENEKIDPETKRPILDDNGVPIIEATEIRMARFRPVNVFDVKQTYGEPLPTLTVNIDGNVEQYEAFMDALRAVSPLPINFEPMPDEADGLCYYGDKIVIREGMSEIQTVCAIIHEMTHAKLHDIESLNLADESAVAKTRRTEEVEAESVAYVVCQYFNIDTGANSFGYITEWSKTRELNELNSSLDTIQKTAAELIDAIDGKFQKLVKERNIVFDEPDTPTAVISEANTNPNAEPPLTMPNNPDPSLPDPAASISEMNDFGYVVDEMLPLTNSRAAELFDSGHCIYLLNPGNSEAMVFEREEIMNHDGLFGIERSDWERSTYSQLGNKSEQYNGPTTAELEAEVRAGNTISLLDLAHAVKAEQESIPAKSTTSKGTLSQRLEDGKLRASQHGQSSTPKLKDADTI